MSSYVSKRRYCHTNGCDYDVIINSAVKPLALAMGIQGASVCVLARIGQLRADNQPERG